MVKNKVNVLHYDQEVRDGFSKNAMHRKIVLCTKKNLGYVAGTTVALGLSDSLLVPSWFLVSSGFPAPGAWCLCSLVGVASNLRIPEFIDNSAQQQIVLVSCFFLQ